MRLIDLDNLDYEDLYTRDEIYYRNTFESGVRSTLNKLAKGKEQIVHCKDCIHWGTGVKGETKNVKCCPLKVGYQVMYIVSFMDTIICFNLLNGKMKNQFILMIMWKGRRYYG